MNAERFQNALRIMYSLDEVQSVLSETRAKEFHADPLRTAMRMDEPTWAKVYALIEARQSKRQTSSDGAVIEALEQCEEYFDSRADAEYFTDRPQPIGNEEMHLLVVVQAALKLIRMESDNA